MQVKQVATADLIPFINNARTHSEAQVAQIAASIKEFGFNSPILTDGANGVIAGHGRLLAAQKLKLKEVPCISLEHLTPAQKKAYIIADNKLGLNASWDDELLKLELDDLHHLDFNLELLGFSQIELNHVLGFDLNENNYKTEEIKPSFDLAHKCPKCGFEYDD